MARGQAAVAAAQLLALISGVAANFQGDGTYYGDNGWAGYCAGNVPNAGKPWPPGPIYGTRVALNQPQAGPHGATDFCGRKLMFRGIPNQGSGGSPISGNWQEGMVTNVCPECKYGDLDLGKNGDGRWKIEWYWLDDGNTGTGAVQTESATKGRAVVPKQSAPAPKPKPAPTPAPKKPMTPEQKQARVSYIFQRLKAAKWLKVMQSTKYGNVYRNALRMRKLANMRAAKFKKVMMGRKLLGL